MGRDPSNHYWINTHFNSTYISLESSMENITQYTSDDNQPGVYSGGYRFLTFPICWFQLTLVMKWYQMISNEIKSNQMKSNEIISNQMRQLVDNALFIFIRLMTEERKYLSALESSFEVLWKSNITIISGGVTRKVKFSSLLLWGWFTISIWYDLIWYDFDLCGMIWFDI